MRLLAYTAVRAGRGCRDGRGRGGHPGVTATEIKIGNTVPYSGPASSYGVLGKLESAFFNMVNEQGGVGGRKINFISLDDNYSRPENGGTDPPPGRGGQGRLHFRHLGTPTNSAIVRYMNQKKVPQLFVSTGADKWGNYKETPWTIGWQPSYRVEAQIYAKNILKKKPDAKIGILYQNDDFGKDYLNGIKDELGDKFGKMVVTATYETTDPTIDSQITTLKASGANVLLVAAIPKFAAQAIKKVHDLNWKPMFFLSNVSISVGAVMTRPGRRTALASSARVIQRFLRSNLEERRGPQRVARVHEQAHAGCGSDRRRLIAAYGLCKTMLQVLQQANGDFSRENIMKQVTSLHDVANPVLLPGIKINTSPTNYHPIGRCSWRSGTARRGCCSAM